VAMHVCLAYSPPTRRLRVTSASVARAEAVGVKRFEHQASDQQTDLVQQNLLLREVGPLVMRVERALAAGSDGQAMPMLQAAPVASHYAFSLLKQPGSGRLTMLAVSRQLGQSKFTPREQRIVHLLHEQVDRFFDEAEEAAANWSDVLPPYLKRIVPELLAGQGEKQIAAKLGFEFNTVHQYIKFLYRRLGVSSRAEFMARCLSERDVLGSANQQRAAFPIPEGAMSEPTAGWDQEFSCS